jgi:hypothetical protein
VLVLLAAPSVRWHARRIPAALHDARVAARSVKKQQRTPLGKYIEACHRIASTSTIDTMVYVPKSETSYFGAFDTTTYRECEVAPFILVKECARPLLYGVPSNDPICADSVMVKRWLGAEYANYPDVPSQDELCREARRFGMTRYVSLHWNPDISDVETNETTCQ